MARPIGLAMLFLMAAAPVLPWRKASTEVLSVRLFWPAVIGMASMALRPGSTAAVGSTR